MKLNLFTMLKDGVIKRIISSGALQNEITTFFEAIASDYKNDKEEVIFDGRYIVDANEISKIENYPIDSSLIEAIRNPLTIDILNLKNDSINMQFIFCGIWDDSNKKIYFQTFDSRKLLSKKFTLLNSGDTFTKLSDPGIIFDTKIDVLFESNTIYFYSYHNARRVIDLSDYYREATDQDLKNFTDEPILDFEDKSWFIDNSDTAIRKKVGLLQKNDVLKYSLISEIQSEAKKLSIDISFSGTGTDKKIVLPKDKKKVKEIIRFLDEDYFIAPITKKRCLTNSKKYL